MTDNVDIERLHQLIDDAERIVFFTGAGISTESGIPDFRSPGTGLWTKMKPIQFQDFMASEEVRQESWRRRFTGARAMENARPNVGHRAIAALGEAGKLLAVITQNVDNLHQDSGVPDDQVIELHGNASYATCLSCGLRYEMADLEAQFKERERIEPCSRCGGVIKSATISFGQSMPEAAMGRAQAAVEACDLCVVVGSSLRGLPRRRFPRVRQAAGRRPRHPQSRGDTAGFAGGRGGARRDRPHPGIHRRHQLTHTTVTPRNAFVGKVGVSSGSGGFDRCPSHSRIPGRRRPTRRPRRQNGRPSASARATGDGTVPPTGSSCGRWISPSAFTFIM